MTVDSTLVPARSSANNIEVESIAHVGTHYGRSLQYGPMKGDRTMTNMTIPFSGGCACGAIRYESTSEPVMMLHCLCRDCQRSSGDPFSSFVIVPTEAFKLLQGSLRFHDSPRHAGGNTHRSFCTDCGSPIQVKTDSAPHIAAIRTAGLDDPSWFNPRFTDKTAAWMVMS